MRILQIGKYYPPHKGGMETVLRDLCEGLLEAGHPVQVLVAGEDGDDRLERIESRGLTGRLVRCGCLQTIMSQPLTPSLYAHVRRSLAEFKPDIVQVHLPNPLAAAMLLALKRDMPRETLLTAWYHADITRQQVGARLIKPVITRLLAACNGIVVSTPELVRHSAWLDREDPRLRVIPFGISPQRWQVPESSPRRGFLFIGRLVYYKGLSVLLEAMTRVPEAQLRLVGGGPLESGIREDIRRLGLSDRVEMLGEVTDDNLKELIAVSEALILPSDMNSETFGLVQLEAMAGGLPVISCNLPTGVSSVNVHRTTGLLVEPGDPTQLAAAMAEILASPEIAREWGRAGIDRVESLYHRDRMAVDVIAWMDDLRRGFFRTGGMKYGF